MVVMVEENSEDGEADVAEMANTLCSPNVIVEVEVVKRFGVLYDAPIVKLKNPVSMLMGGLKPEVGTLMRMFQATTLSETYRLARMQEATNTILKPRMGAHKPYRLTQRELEEKRAKGQCFYYDQKYALGETLKRKGKVVVGNDPELRKELVQHFYDKAIGGHYRDHWLPKLLGYDYEIVYKNGSENVVADALLRMDSSGELLQISISSVSSGVWDKVKDSKTLKRKGKVVVGNDPELRKEIVQHFYDKAIGGHYRDHTEVVNRSLGCYMRCMCGEKPKEWVKWLPLAEFWYNTNYHTSTKTTPYEAVYCQTPPIYVPYIPGDSRVEKVDRTLQAREKAIKVLKFHLKSKAMTTPVKSNSVGQSSGYVTRKGAHKPYRLTQRELQEKTAMGQCFYCDKNTHNFLDIHTAKKLGCRLAKTIPMQVLVANGEVVKRFGVLYDDPIVELKNLKQTRSVQTYQEALLNRVDLPELVALLAQVGPLYSTKPLDRFELI
nr:reverse transcriptase [Tanacetum cinerariifolium]